MARKPRKSTAARWEMEARRRRSDAARIAEQTSQSLAQRAAQVAAEIRQLQTVDTLRTMHEVAERRLFGHRFAEAMAVTDDFAWKPWGYERTEPYLPQPLRIVVDNTMPKVPASARARFDRTLRYPNVQRVLAGVAA